MSDSNSTVGGNRRRYIVRITTTAIFTALAVGLMFLEVPLPLMPPFLKFDFSEIPVLVGTFALGPVYGIIIELLKNLIHLPWTGTMAIGEMSNFITGSIFVGTAGLIYRKNRTRKGAVISMIAATLALAVIAVPVNAFINLPLYASVLGMTMESILGWTQTVNPAIDSELKLLLLGFVPFNLFKGIVVSAITFCVYKPISKLINRTYENTKV
ncbi:MAG: ECF transporter S component [Clostridiales bacterium]|nr:ECF transporter S component [Clostridiales bacterium]